MYGLWFNSAALATKTKNFFDEISRKYNFELVRYHSSLYLLISFKDFTHSVSFESGIN